MHFPSFPTGTEKLVPPITQIEALHNPVFSLLPVFHSICLVICINMCILNGISNMEGWWGRCSNSFTDKNKLCWKRVLKSGELYLYLVTQSGNFKCMEVEEHGLSFKARIWDSIYENSIRGWKVVTATT